MRNFRQKTGDWVEDRRGNIAIMFTVALIPILLVVNFAIDYASVSNVRSNLQSLADAVALAAVNKLPDTAAADKAGNDVYNAGIAEFRAGLLSENLSMSFTVEPDLVSDVTISGAYKAPSGMNFNLGDLSFVIKAKAKIPLVKLEVAVAADATYSMKGTKITALKTALKRFSDILMAAQSDTAEVRMAMVPFSRAVTLPSYASTWMGPAGKTNTGATICATKRGGVYDSSDLNPDAEKFDGYDEIRNGCTDFVIQPLTKDAASVTSLINSLTASGWGTANQVASEWVFRALSPAWDQHWPADSAPRAWDKATKIAVLMTDGENEFYTYEHDHEGDDALEKTCENMKAKGIEIYAVTFMTPLAVRPIYQKCVSSPGNLIEASSGAQLTAAFERIAKEATSKLMRLTN